MVFSEVALKQNEPGHTHHPNKAQHRAQLDGSYGAAFLSNEGQAAEQGVFYDDTRYDYMQHMRELGASREATWIDAPSKDKKEKGKQRLEDALQNLNVSGDDAQSVSVASTRQSVLPEDAMGSEYVMKRTYQDQQDVPDAIAGFNPDMDPRLREVLEALEDDAYVDDEDDIFADLADGEVVDEQEWEEGYYNDDDQGWESDATVKADEHKSKSVQTPIAPLEHQDPHADLPPPSDPLAAPPEIAEDGAWLAEFSKFKKAPRPRPHTTEQDDVKSNLAPSSNLTGLSSLAAGRHKKRKGAKTSTTNYSMTSSALARTEQLTTLDDRFDSLLDREYGDEYADSLSQIDEGDENMSLASGATGLSRGSRASYASRASNVSACSKTSGISTYSRASDAEAPKLVPSQFDDILDQFISTHSTVGKRGRQRVRRGVGKADGLEQLDDVRGELGRPRTKKGAA